MATRPLGTGYDPNSGWPPDDSTNIGWSDVDLTGYGRFGPGGFTPNPRLTGPASGPPPGMSLFGPGGAGGAASSASGPQYYGPQNPPLRNAPAVRTGPGPFTDVTPNATPGIWDRLKGLFPGILAGVGPAAVPALAVGGAGAGLWAEPRTPRVDPRISAFGSMGNDVEQPLGAAPSTYRPEDSPSFTAPNPYGAGMPRGSPPAPYRPEDSPSFARPTAPAVPPIRPKRMPAATGPAAAAQQPNLGAYMIDRPNMPAGQQGGRGGPSQTKMGVFGWDPNGPLFGRGG